MKKVADFIQFCISYVPTYVIISLLIVTVINVNLFEAAKDAKLKVELTDAAEAAKEKEVTAVSSDSLSESESAYEFQVPVIYTMSREDSLARLEQNLILERKRNSEEVPWLEVVIVTIGFVVVIAAWFYVGRQKIVGMYEQDKDPAALEKVFIQHNNEILNLGTPRKIKRFSNRVRFQYYLFRVNETELDFFFKVLLHYEANRIRITQLHESEFRAMYYKEFQYSASIEADQLLEKIYDFNKNNLV